MPAASPRVAFPPNWPARIGWLVLAAYVVWATAQLDFTWERFVSGIDNGSRFLSRMFPPAFGADKVEMIVKGLTESLQITFIATVLGIALSLPIGLMAARNLMPAWVVWPARTLIAVSRSFHEVVVAIIFVKAVGFGAMAGIGALVVGSIGFVAKLFAEAIEEISPKQVEAVRATGASFMSVVLFGVLPQVFSRFLGFATYQFDSNLRHSTMIGIVGAGGIGGTLFAAFQRFDYDFVCAILISIIVLIMIGEIISNFVRALFSENLSVIEWFRRKAPERRDKAVAVVEG
ncbi:MAG TPA: phosphonate ABC transporter, permease protein PhnE [Usitatibacteraceae bacterium]|nr:phosphonate ABC transporter, permease protein PhnE [Usitatibacteraceae bacterium]